MFVALKEKEMEEYDKNFDNKQFQYLIDGYYSLSVIILIYLGI